MGTATTSGFSDCVSRFRFEEALYHDDEATFVISSTGNVLARPTEPIDENDKVTVVVVGPTSELELLQVRRSSAVRPIGGFNVLGQDANFGKGIDFHSASGQVECGSMQVQLADFAPGKGEVTIAKLAGSQSTPVSTFDFSVNPLYRGALSFGPVYSWLTDRSYGTVMNGSASVITITDQSPNLHYVLSYTHYIWGRIDEEKAYKRPVWKRIYPTIGLSLRSTLRNVFVGGTYDVMGTSVYLTGGAHIGRVTVIDPITGLGVGQTLPSSLSSVPTRTETDVDWFLGLSIDLRAATKFFAAFGNATTSAAR